MFIKLTKKYVDLKNELNRNDALPFDLETYRLSFEQRKSYDVLLWETFNNNPTAYANNYNVVSFLLNTEHILSVTDCTTENFNNPYWYYYIGSKTKILLKNNNLIYVTENFDEIMEKINHS